MLEFVGMHADNEIYHVKSIISVISFSAYQKVTQNMGFFSYQNVDYKKKLKLERYILGS